MPDEKQKKIEKTTDELAKEQLREEPEMHHLPTVGKKPGELEDFEKSLDNDPEKKENAE